MYDKKCISVTSHASDPHSPLSQTVTPSRTPSNVTYFMDGPIHGIVQKCFLYEISPCRMRAISRFDISASAIGFDLNTRLLGPRLVESTCCAHMRSEEPMAIFGLLSFSCMTL